MTIRLGPGLRRRSTRRRSASGWSPTASAATRWAPSPGCGRAATTGFSSPAVGGPAARMLGLAALDPVLVARRRARPARDRRVGGGTVEPARARAARLVRARRTASRAGAGRSATSCRARARDGHGAPAVGVVHRLLRADRPVRLELTPLCTWRNVHGERFACGAPAVEATADGFVFEGAYRVAGAGLASRAASWYRGVRCARGGRARAERPRGRLGRRARSRVELAPGERPRGDRGRRAVRRRAPAARRRSSHAARERAAALRPAAGADGRRSTRSSCSRPTSSSIATAAARPRSPATPGSASGRAT